ncbi:MAG: NUDIX hydrolase [Calditrichaeota bacterium]|jgi:8-oxo-dGTP diphosphatase|nr:NUDIX hydrolase [Calditrichota bacterium]
MTPPITKVSASIIIFDPIDRVLLAKRSFQKLEDPGLWETIGGTLEFGESPETCLRREVTEEIGCKIASLQLFNVYNYLSDNIHLISVVYLGVLFGRPKVYNIEIEDVRWFSEHEIDSIEFSINCKQRVLDYFLFKHSQKQNLN